MSFVRFAINKSAHKKCQTVALMFTLLVICSIYVFISPKVNQKLRKHQDESYGISSPKDKITAADSRNLHLKKHQEEYTVNAVNSAMNEMTAANDQNLILYLRNNFLMAPSSLPYNLTTNKTEQKLAKGLTWRFIDKTLKILFADQRNGFFVEAGALNGEVLSNTLRLERDQNWTGLLIEPVPHNFKELVQKRRKAWASQACLSNTKHPKIVTMTEVRCNDSQVIPDMYARGSSYQKGYSDNDVLKDPTLKKNFFKSHCFSLYSYLLALNVTTVDFLSLDIQGPELEVFNTIPFNKIYIRSMVIANIQNNGLRIVDKKFVDNIEEKGFKFIAVRGIGGSVDYFFVNQNDKTLVKKSFKVDMELIMDL